MLLVENKFVLELRNSFAAAIKLANAIAWYMGVMYNDLLRNFDAKHNDLYLNFNAKHNDKPSIFIELFSNKK